MPNFVHLHVHSHYSLLDGLGKIPELIHQAKDFGMDALALTDHGVLYGAIEFYSEAKKAGLKPIVGIEAYLAPRKMTDRTPKIDTTPYHQLLLAKNMTGYKNLLKLTSAAHLQGYYYKPRFDHDLLVKHSDGLIATSSCLAGIIPQKLLANDYEGAKALAAQYADLFGPDNFYLELQYHPKLSKQGEANSGLKKLARDLHLPLIATGDIHYVKADDKETHETLLAINTGKDLDSNDRLTLEEVDLYMESPAFFAEKFADVPEALDNTVKIANACNLEIPLGESLLPHFSLPPHTTPDKYLRELCETGLKQRYPDITQTIKDRFEYELSTIAGMGFASYFLIVSDFVNWAKNQGILVGPGRGSAAGSIIAYALNITDIDPLQYGLLFERFLNPDRISMPDIDMDFADDRRAEVIQYVRDKYGDDHVAGIITYGTMMSRAAVRDVGRALGMSYADVDAIAKLIPPPAQGRHIPLHDSIKKVPDLKDIYATKPDAKRLLDLACRIEGTVRHASQHACAIVISKDPLTEYVPLQGAQKGDVGQITQYSMKPIEEIGLLKMDFLGLANLTVMANATEIIDAVHGQKIDIHHLPLDDKKTYALLGRAETTGVFQLESAGMKRYIKELKPTTLEEIAIMVALYRPGPMQWIESFINRRHNREKTEYPHPLTENALKETYGIPIYQEQVMQVSRDMAGFTGGEADTLRKAMGKKIAKLMKQMRVKFVEGSVKNKVDKQLAEKIFTEFEEFAAYGFNKSHAVGYALVAYQTAYLKAHYPECFMAALMSSDFQNIDRISIEIDECHRLGLPVLPPDVNESFVEFGVVKDEFNIRFGLSAVKNVGVGVADAIVAQRKQNGPYQSLEDFAGRLGTTILNKKVVEALVKAGALDRFGERNQLLAGTEAILKYAANAEKQATSNQMDLFAPSPQPSPQPSDNSSPSSTLNPQPSGSSIPLPDIPPAEKKQRLAWEKELLGIYISEHPLKEIETVLPDIATPVKDLSEDNIGRLVRVAGIITDVRKILTKNQESMLFMKLEDFSGSLEAVVFPKLYEKVNLLCQTDNIVIVEGKINSRDNELKLLADSIEEIGHQETFDDLIQKQQKLVQRHTKPGSRSASSSGNSPPSTFTPSLGSRTRLESKAEGLHPNASSPSSPLNSPPSTLSPSPLVLTLPAGANQKTLAEIKTALEKSLGDTPILLRIPHNSHFKEIKTRTKVDPTSELITKLEAILGRDNISLPNP